MRLVGLLDERNVVEWRVLINPNLQFTAEMEENKTINYLDITIHRTPYNWKVAIYRKPTFTNTIIPYTSNHPPQHKHAAIKFLDRKSVV